MKQISTLLSLLAILIVSSCSQPISEKQKKDQSESQNLELIPFPKKVDLENGELILKSNFKVQVGKNLKPTAELFKDWVEEKFESQLSLQDQEQINSNETYISLAIDTTLSISTEGYQLKSSEKLIEVIASTPLGLHWGVQSLKQLLFQFYHEDNSEFRIPLLAIEDEPAFPHRGMLLDACRHFFDIETVKHYIDLLSYYKMNVLHWHLTEDQGWRIEIKKYPKLTEIGSWRTDSSGNKYGGYYTQKEIKEVVQYAMERNITIIPEIELPGHSQAALSAYPQFSCIGNGIEVVNDWGVFKEIYCAGNDSTFIFLQDVLSEVSELFPSNYIHIGGDEAPKFRWKNCEKCQKRMNDNQLHDEHELQSYFIKKIETFLNSKGKNLIGWDEILEGGLSPNATVQCWRGVERAIEAANQNHTVVMSPTSHCYFDYDLKKIDLAKVYEFDPIPDTLKKDKSHLILGGECNLWSEHIPDKVNLDSKVFPRIFAISEVLWTYPKQRDFPSFLSRVRNQYTYLKTENVNYGLEGEVASINTFNKENKTFINLEVSLPGLELHYSFNESRFRKYEKNIQIKEDGTLKVQAYWQGNPYGRELVQQVSYHNALGIVPKYVTNYNKWYTGGGDSALTDGLKGSIDFRDGHWQGYWGNDMALLFDFKEKKRIEFIEASFYQYNNAWIFFPKEIEFFASTDNQIWRSLGKYKIRVKPQERGKLIEKVYLNLEGKNVEAQYIRAFAQNLGKVPDWHEAAGSDAWIFADEISIDAK